ncbi:MAG: putative motility protein [Betaproteobacteria bacterium]|nr:putative motility protein [Betaproteobacteria bacterium]
MDVTSIASALSAASAARVGDAIQVSVLKKALDTQAQGAMALIQALPPVNPPHLGQRIDIKA